MMFEKCVDCGWEFEGVDCPFCSYEQEDYESEELFSAPPILGEDDLSSLLGARVSATAE